MTEETMDRLANEAINEAALNLKLFATDHVQNKAHVWALSFSGKNGESREVKIDLWDSKTDEAVKAEIKRQLTSGR